MKIKKEKYERNKGRKLLKMKKKGKKHWKIGKEKCKKNKEEKY